jgi:nicotinamide-nucleotide amidase
MTLSVSILATGSELLDGRVVDTNSNFVAKELAERGLRLKRVLVVDDDMDELLAGLKELSEISTHIITSGGLGPTGDDLTRDVVAAFCGVTLAEFPEARKHLEDFYSQRNRVLDASNIKQALLPTSSIMIPNPVGTAPGFIARGPGGVTICSLSGVPSEFKRMFADTVEPLLERSGAIQQKVERRTMKLFGYPESRVGMLVQGCGLDSEIAVSYRAAFPEVHVVLKSGVEGVDLDAAVKLVECAVNADTIFSRSLDERFEQCVQQVLRLNGESIAVAESCTGGLLGELLTRTAGASSVFQGGIIAYSNEIKRDLLGVPSSVLDTYGAVSQECVESMASAVRERCKATYGLAISGVAGPEGGTPEKPVGTFYVACASLKRTVAVRCLYISERQRIRTYAAYVALDLVRRMAQGMHIPTTYPFE